MTSVPQSESDLPAELANPARRALASVGITRLDQLTTLRETEVKQLHGMGPKALGILRSALAARRLLFAGDAEEAADSP